MNHISASQAPYTVCNSSLSEYGVLGNKISTNYSLDATFETLRFCKSSLCFTLIYVDLCLPVIRYRF